MRLIDADKLNVDFYDEFETDDDAYVYRYVSEHQIDTAPSIDIVRCQDCKYWNMVSNGCMRNPSVEGWQADDFCSYGMRNADPNTLNTLDALDDNSSEKPNNCEDLQDWKDRMWAEAIVTEPTISKMEQVDEPQTERSE